MGAGLRRVPVTCISDVVRKAVGKPADIDLRVVVVVVTSVAWLRLYSIAVSFSNSPFFIYRRILTSWGLSSRLIMVGGLPG